MFSKFIYLFYGNLIAYFFISLGKLSLSLYSINGFAAHRFSSPVRFCFFATLLCKKETQDEVYFLHFSLTSKLKSTKLFDLFSFKELHTLLFFSTLVLFCFALSANLFYTISMHLTSIFLKFIKKICVFYN